MADVYHARDELLNRDVALKFPNASALAAEGGLARMKREAAPLRAFNMRI